MSKSYPLGLLNMRSILMVLMRIVGQVREVVFSFSNLDGEIINLIAVSYDVADTNHHLVK